MVFNKSIVCIISKFQKFELCKFYDISMSRRKGFIGILSEKYISNQITIHEQQTRGTGDSSACGGTCPLFRCNLFQGRLSIYL